MSRTNRHKRKKKPHKRTRRWWHKLTWKDILVYGPLALFFVVVAIGPFVYEFCYHRDVEYALVLVAAVAMLVFFLRPGKKS